MFKKEKRFYFNKDNLTIYKQERSFRQIALRYIILIVSGLMLGFIGFIVSSSTFHTKADRKLLKENNLLRREYKILNDQLDLLSTTIQLLSRTDDSLYRAVLGADPVSQGIREAGMGGRSVHLKSGTAYPEIVEKTAKKIDKLIAKSAIQRKSYDHVRLLATRNKKRMLHLPAIIPIHNKDLTRTGSGFGMRFHPILNYWRPHYGIDFNAPAGTPVYATARGRVSSAGVSKTFGKIVRIAHGYGYETLYGHLSRYDVKKGQMVNRGDTIGFVGSTGLSSGNHLHYEIHLNGKPVDPVHYYFGDLDPEEYDKIIELSKTNLFSMD